MSADLEDLIRATLHAWADEIEAIEQAEGADGASDPTEAPAAPQPASASATGLRPVRDAGRPSARHDLASRTAGDHGPSRLRAALAAVAAIVILVVAAVALRPMSSTVETGTPPSEWVPAPAPPSVPGPHYVATVLPAGFAPVLRIDNPPVGSGLPEEPAETVQRFAVGAGSVLLVVHPVQGPTGDFEAPDGPVRSLPAWSDVASGGPGVWWEEGRAQLSAFRDGVDEAQTRQALESLALRTDDPVDGFDVRSDVGTGEGGMSVRLVAEQTWPRGAAKPAFSSVYYAPIGGTEPTLVVSASAAAGTPDLDLIAAQPAGRREVVAGAERVVVDEPDRSEGEGGGGGAGTRTIAWFDADGTFVTILARGVGADDLDAVVAGVGRADATTWAALDGRISDAIAAMPVATTSRWDDVELTLRGDPRRDGAVPGEWEPDGACIRTAEGEPTCGAFLEARTGLYGSTLITSSGRFGGTTWMIESGQCRTTVSRPDGWWILGAFDSQEDVRVVVGTEQVAQQWSTPLDDRAIVYAARLPADVASATVVAGYLAVPNGTEVPQTGVPEWREDATDVARPAP